MTSKEEKNTKCEWYLYTDYYETDCGNQMEKEDYDSTQPTYCPFCGNKIDNQEEIKCPE